MTCFIHCLFNMIKLTTQIIWRVHNLALKAVSDDTEVFDPKCSLNWIFYIPHFLFFSFSKRGSYTNSSLETHTFCSLWVNIKLVFPTHSPRLHILKISSTSLCNVYIVWHEIFAEHAKRCFSACHKFCFQKLA